MQAPVLALLLTTSSLLALADTSTADPITVGPVTLDGTNSTVDPNWTPQQNATAVLNPNHSPNGPVFIAVTKVCVSRTCVGGPCVGASQNQGYGSGTVVDGNGVEVRLPRYNFLPGVQAYIALSC